MKVRALMAVILLGTASWSMAMGPMTYKDISLMLRTGMSEQQILADLNQRKLAAALSPQEEKSLQQLGASAAFVGALKAPGVQASPMDLKTAASQLQHSEPPPQLPPLPPPASIPTGGQSANVMMYGEPFGPASPMFNALDTSHFVSLQGDRLDSFDRSHFSHVRYYAIYFSAHWCPPCRRFTPELVKFYNEVKPRNPHFELIFVSQDQSESEMKEYMTGTQMKWPAMNYDEAQLHSNPLAKYCGRGIPCLVFVDAKGNVLSDSYEGTTYVGPAKVARDIAQTLQQNPPTQMELSVAR